MRIEISHSEVEKGFHVDRDGALNLFNHQGLYTLIGGVEVHFEDENDARALAVAILERLGEKPQEPANK